MSRTHQMYGTPEYHAWSGMIQRCTNPNGRGYPDYGGRGIRVAQSWRASFAAFYADMGSRPSSRHSLERKNPNGDYEPSNCIWALPVDQSNNRRNSRFETAFGQTLTIGQWSTKLGVNYGKLLNYLNYRHENTVTTFCTLQGIAQTSKGEFEQQTRSKRLTRKINPEKMSWIGMVQRCRPDNEQDRADYADRGIFVVPEWIASFETFLRDMGPKPTPKHTLERKDVNGPYSPANCVWADAVTQGNNKRNNVKVTAFGRTQTAAQWARELNIPYRRLWWNVTAGPGLEEYCARLGITPSSEPDSRISTPPVELST